MRRFEDILKIRNKKVIVDKIHKLTYKFYLKFLNIRKKTTIAVAVIM